MKHVCSFSLHSTCTHCQRAGEALACVTCTLSSHLQDRFSLFSFGQDHPSLLGMKIIFQTHWVFPSFIAEYCLLWEWRIMKPRPRKVKQSYTSEFSAWIFVCIPHLLLSESSQANWREGDQGDLWYPGNHRQNRLTASTLACIWSFLNDFFSSIKDLYLERPVPNHLSKEQFHYEKLIPLLSAPLGKIRSLVDLVQHKWKLLNWSHKVAWSRSFCLALWISCCFTTYAIVWHVIRCREMLWSTSLKFLPT